MIQLTLFYLAGGFAEYSTSQFTTDTHTEPINAKKNPLIYSMVGIAHLLEGLHLEDFQAVVAPVPLARLGLSLGARGSVVLAGGAWKRIQVR